MNVVFIVGLPTQLQYRLKAQARAGGKFVKLVLATKGREGYFRLCPDPSLAIYEFNGYLDSLNGGIEEAEVLVLPYAPIPDLLEEDLRAFIDLGGKVTRPLVGDGVDGWPKATVSEFDDRFFDLVFEQLVKTVFPQGIPKQLCPSEFFSKLSERQKNLLIPAAAISNCDAVARHRYKFMLKAAAALEEIAANGLNCGVDEHFKSLGLIHAQSGGIYAEIRVFREGKEVHKGGGSTHLKEGDNTNKNAAARIYYYCFNMSGPYVAILYAGPHPDSDVSRKWSMDG